MKVKNKKPIIALILLLAIATVGATYAYFTNSKTFDNLFTVNGGYNPEITEEFESPDNWTPGEEITKKITVRNNTGNVPIAVRVRYTEEWKSSTGTTLSGNLADGTRAAIINYATDLNTKWKKVGEYYYYYQTIPAGQTSSSFIESVTLSTRLDSTNDANYVGGTYKLTITAETIQATGAASEWSIDSTVINGI